MSKYNHMLDVCFVVESDKEDWKDLSTYEMVVALEMRVNYLKGHPQDAAEAFGYCDTTNLEGTY